MKEKTKTCLALGDSYTAGTGITTQESLPFQLAAALHSSGIPLSCPHVVARNGWTTNELLEGLAAEKLQAPYDLVTLLIGVNNQYQGWSVEEYKLQFASLLAQAICLAGGSAAHVIVFSIPDWSVTPFAAQREPERIAAEINAYNAANQAETQRTHAHYVDITPISRLAAHNPALLANDQLHPSGVMIANWVGLALPIAESILN